MYQITNRAIIILRPKTPFIEWVRNYDEESKILTTEEIMEEPNAYMVHDYTMDGEKDLIIKENYKTLFKLELNNWITDESAWPKKRDMKTFKQWFHVEFHSMVFDLCDEDYILEE